ncbi:FtsX-like permease family protein (plasmid) [Entomospira entomophila]|uniref:FtsX-like permease family protein n=1 Tax=Entomospira entomophila TaxID=2719988 RepID=A0A968KS68_9SPIO|nr:FtsX-like permease family protein [Entomospira entomophilus]NIZ41429.1 FtsX-like permease family protein [Entomospira entomophilus]WDI36379.1 FtsX-like permease family protein [Entomospira entomophilus]
MLVLQIAFRNLFRNKSRTLVTLFAIGLSVATYLFLDSFIHGMDYQAIANLTSFDTGYAQILSKDAFENRGRPSLEDATDLSAIKQIVQEAGLDAQVERVSQAEVIFYASDGFDLDGNLTLEVRFVDADNQKIPALKSGQSLQEWSKGNSQEATGIWMSQYYAYYLGAKIGMPITMRITTAYGSQELLDGIITGFFETDNSIVNQRVIFADWQQSASTLELDSLTQGNRLTFYRPIPQKKILSLPEPYQLYTYQEINPEFVAVAKFNEGRNSIFLFFIFFVIVIGISNTVMMAIYERFKEIATLRAFGMPSLWIRLLFFWEGLFLGILGAIIGVMIGSLINLYMIYVGLDIAAVVEQNNNLGYPINSIIRGRFAWSPILFISGLVVVLTAVFSFTTTRVALKRSIVESLHS